MVDMTDKLVNGSPDELSSGQDLPSQETGILQKKPLFNWKLLGITIGVLALIGGAMFYVLTNKANDKPTGSISPTPQTSITISPAVYDNPEAELYLSISENLAINQGGTVGKESGNILLGLVTKKEYGCSNYQLDSSVTTKGGKIEVDVKGVKEPNICQTAMGPAIFSQDLGKLEGQYTLIVRDRNEEDNYSLIITARDINIQTISSSVTSLKRGNILRFPTGTIIVGCWKNQETLCGQFFKDLKILGASEADNQEYVIQLNKDMKEKAGEVESPTDFILYNHSGDSAALDNLITKYVQNKEAMIEVYTWEGNALFTWTRR